MSGIGQDVMDMLEGGAPGQLFPSVGYTWGGTLMSAEQGQKTDMETGEPKVWSDGKPQIQLILTLQGEPTGFKYEGQQYDKVGIDDDDGVRRLFLSGNKLKALKDALRVAKSKLEIGGHFTLKREKDGEAPKKGYARRQNYSGIWVPAHLNTHAMNEALKADTGTDGEESPF